MSRVVHPVLAPQHSRKLLMMSWCIFFSVLAAVINQRLDCALAASCVLFTSVNYWRHPVLGFRRNLDILMTSSCFVYQLVVVSPNASGYAKWLYWSTVLACGCCYAKARHCGRVLHKHANASWWHFGIHLCGNIGNFVLYFSVSNQAIK